MENPDVSWMQGLSSRLSAYTIAAEEGELTFDAPDTDPDTESESVSESE
jgi:hypothetical protein